MTIVIPDKVIEKNVIIEVDQKNKSGLYTMCKQFKEMREPYKRQNTHEAKSASNALKIMVNTFYGANTNPYMSYGDLAVGIAITGVARWLIMGARKIIEMSAGDVVVYIHTDGVNTNADVDLDFVNHNLQKATKEVFPLAEPEWVEVEKDVFKEESKGLVDSMFPHLDTDQRTNLANLAVYMPPQDFMRILEGDLYKDPMKAMDAETRAITISNLTRLAEDGHPGAQILLNHLIKQDLRTEGLIGKNEYTLNLTSGENIVVNQDGTAKLVDELGNISDVPYNLTEEQKKEILQGGGVPKNFFNSK